MDMTHEVHTALPPVTSERGGERLPMMRLRGITKVYPGAEALKGVDIDLFEGEVHALVGENGAGKSTLIKIACGAVPATTGSIEIEGRAVTFSHPSEAKAEGVVAVHQELEVIPALSALANVFLGQERSAYGLLRGHQMEERFKALATELGVEVDLSRRADRLSIADQQSLEIMRGLLADAKVLILDEPTAAIGADERQALYRIVRRLRSRQVAVLFISHDLREVQQLADRISVLRDGCLVDTRLTQKWTRDALVEGMLGANVAATRRTTRERDNREEVLRVENVCVPGKVEDVSFRLDAGEILGLAGLVGSGRTELLRALAGADPQASGRLYIAEREVHWPRQPRTAIRYGIALASEDRKKDGLCLGLPAYANVTLTDPWKSARAGFLTTSAEVAAATPVVERVALQKGTLRRSAKALSGGNQQKLVLAKWLAARVKILLVDEPTRGVDVGAKMEIFTALRALASTGVGIVLVSSELEEVVDNSDRLLVLSRGRVVGELCDPASTEEDVLKLIFADAKEER